MEELRLYLNSLSLEEQREFATKCGTSIGYLRNLQKAAFDALTKAGFWLDDAQVVDYRVVKMPVTKGGRLELTITEMGNE